MTAQHPGQDREQLRRDQVCVRCEPVGKVDLLGPSFGGDPYGLSLAFEVVAGVSGGLWRLVVGRGRWRVLVTERDSDSVIFSQVYRNKRVAMHEGVAQVDALFTS
ncbi:hypothetical protein ABEG17_05140 [Pedococcus sp. KACC 23699]|uniref:Uncharacterized protein n=1 Tax=Pedococcus sp. KACC 23699 TaxID=3149228 RepID=A0AAU7JWE0_9MICO